MASFMAFQFLLLVIACIFVFVSCCANGQQKHGSFRPSALVLPVRKDISADTNQYVTTINLRTPSKPTNLVLDLGGRLVWVFLPKDYASFTYSPVHCDSSQCALAEAEGCRNCSTGWCSYNCAVHPRPGCNPNTCYVITPYSRLTSTYATGELAEDLVSIQSTDGSNPGQVVSVPRLLFSDAPSWLKKFLTKHATGVAGLGFSRIGLPWQFASAFGFRRRFAICLPSSTTSDGVVFFGDSPYHFFLTQLSAGSSSSDVIDASQLLSYTPILVDQSAGEDVKRDYHAQYHIRLGSIRVNNKSIPLSTSLLSANRKGDGGTIFSTVLPYTELETSILNSLTTAFVAEAAGMNIDRVPTVAPFPACFSTNSIQMDGTGPVVPSIDLVFEGEEDVVWTITGLNSMVPVDNNVMCLGFVERSWYYNSASIGIGAYQMENILLQFDLENSRLGFSSNLLGRGTSCANFNFTSITN